MKSRTSAGKPPESGGPTPRPSENPWRQHGEDVLLTVRLQPRASRDALTSSAGGILQVRVTAAAVEDAANEAVQMLLAKALGVPRSRISILQGRHGRRKLMRIQGMSEDEAARYLAPTLGHPPKR